MPRKKSRQHQEGEKRSSTVIPFIAKNRSGRSRSEDRSKVNVHHPYELRYWTKALNIGADRPKELVKEHGPKREQHPERTRNALSAIAAAQIR